MKIFGLLVAAAAGAGAAIAAMKFGPQIKETVEAKMKKAADGTEVEDVEVAAEENVADVEIVDAPETADAE